jgi:hypothetical protein
MYHYEKIPFAQLDASTWNNLGTSYQSFGLPGLSVSAYRSAANQGETLTMSNLAEKLMSAGFLDEAHDELLRVRAVDNVHKNVAKSQERLASIRTADEENKESKLDGHTRTKPVSFGSLALPMADRAL